MKDIIREISRNGIKLADHIQMQSQIIRKFSQPHFREGMVSLSFRPKLYLIAVESLGPLLLISDHWRVEVSFGARTQRGGHHYRGSSIISDDKRSKSLTKMRRTRPPLQDHPRLSRSNPHAWGRLCPSWLRGSACQRRYREQSRHLLCKLDRRALLKTSLRVLRILQVHARVPTRARWCLRATL